MEKANKMSRKLYPIAVVIVGLVLSYISYTSKLRGAIEFFVYSLIVVLMIMVGRKVYRKNVS